MLIIRKAQMDLFEAHFTRRFRQDLRRHVRGEFAPQSARMTDADLDKLIGDGLVRGRSHGLATERDLTLFVDLFFLLGVDFERDTSFAWVRRTLLNKALDGSAKVEAIYRRLAAFENAAAAASSPSAM